MFKKRAKAKTIKGLLFVDFISKPTMGWLNIAVKRGFSLSTGPPSS